MNINTEHEEVKTVDNDGDEDWCIVPYSASHRPLGTESPQMLGKQEDDVTLKEFEFVVISSTDNGGDETHVTEDENVSTISAEGELYTDEDRETNPHQRESEEDNFKFVDSHFQLDENSNHLITTTLLHQANFHDKLILKGNKVSFPDIIIKGNKVDDVIDQTLKKSQSELGNLAPHYLTLDCHQDYFYKVDKVEDGKLHDISKNVTSENFFIESLQELQEELNFEIVAESEITDREDLDCPKEDFCDISLENVDPFDEACKNVIPNNFLANVISELQDELTNKEEATKKESLEPEQLPSLEYSQEDFFEVTNEDILSDFKPTSKRTIKSFDEISFSPDLKNTESCGDDIIQKGVINSYDEQNWSCCISSATSFYADEEESDHDEFNLLIRQYQTKKKKCDLKWEMDEELLMKYEQWDSHPAKMNKNRKVAAFNRPRVRLTKKRICRKGHWNCKLKAYHYS